MKEKLAELVEAYATAKATGNQMLQTMAATAFNNFMGGVDVVPIEADKKGAPEAEPEMEHREAFVPEEEA